MHSVDTGQKRKNDSLKIEETLQAMIVNLEESFIYDLLLDYGLSKSAITHLKARSCNATSTQEKVLWKKKVFFEKLVE